MSFHKHLVFLFAVASLVSCKDFNALSDDIIDYVNSLNTTWTAARSPRFPSGNEQDVKVLCGLLDIKHTLQEKKVAVGVVPESFDARQKWPDCPSIGDIRDQGSCGSCWVREIKIIIIINFTCVKITSEVKVDFAWGRKSLHFIRV